MSLAEIQRRSWEENILLSVMLELTYRCNLNCSFCYNDLGLEGRPLELDQYRSLLEELAELQVLYLTLTGGEPLSHPHFFAIGGRARELGFVVRIKSNGHALRGAIARRVQEEIDPYVIDMSLHGAQASTHDRQTRVPGSFDRLMGNIPELLALGLRLKLNCTLTRWNEHEIEEICAIADRFELPLGINPTVSPRDDGDTAPLRIAPSRAARRRLYRVLDGRRQARGASDVEVGRSEDADRPTLPTEKNCGAGSSGLTIDPVGNVLPCVQWRRPVGNLHERSIREIWTTSPQLVKVRELTIEAKSMVDAEGPGGRLMDFCPGMAEAATGSPVEVYEAARMQREVLEELEDEKRRRSPLPIVG